MSPTAIAAWFAAVASVATCHVWPSRSAQREPARTEARATDARKARAPISFAPALELEHAPRSLVPDEPATDPDKARMEQVARERHRYRQMLRRELGWIDRMVASIEREASDLEGDLREDKERDATAARWWRALLAEDLDALRRTGEDAWPVLRDRIESDLEDQRPVSIPSSYERSYAI